MSSLVLIGPSHRQTITQLVHFLTRSAWYVEMEAADQSQTENYGWMGLRMTKQGYGNSANLNDHQAPFSPVDLFLQTEAASQHW